MADFRADSEIVTKFLLNTCRVRHWRNFDAFLHLPICAAATTIRGSSDNDETEWIPLVTGSVAEFYIQPILSCVGDVDIMFHSSDELAIPAGTALPTQLPHEFHSRVKVFEIVDSEFPGYVYLVSSYLLTECVDDGKYNAVHCRRRYRGYEVWDNDHGPAHVNNFYFSPGKWSDRRVTGDLYSQDIVACMRCLVWPTQATNWPTRHRNYDWPDSAAIDRVVSDGCDVVRVAHRQCRRDEWMKTHQWRLSFSRAEIVLLNSWMPVQQIVYHMLRVFVKTERLTDSANNSDVATLSNYHIKTLMLWACELKPRSWWIDDLNVVRLSVELLHTLGVWLTDARCPHYFIHNCNLFDHPDNCYCEIASRLMSETEVSLAKWFISSYIIRRCAQLSPYNVLLLPNDIGNSTKLQTVVSAIVYSRFCMSPFLTSQVFTCAQSLITVIVSHCSLTVRSCLCLMRDLVKLDHRLYMYLTGDIFLHAAYKTTGEPMKGVLLDILATICLQSNNVRRCVNARHSSALSLDQAARLMKVVANNSRSTVQLIEIELSKAYMYRALRCKDSDSDSIYCLANVYLAVLYYATGHYQTAIDHCTLVTRSQDHSQCSSHVVQGELLPKIDDNIDTVLGLSVFYQYVRTAALNQQQQTQHVSVFTTELFAHYLYITCLSDMNCRQITQSSLTDEVRRYQNRLCEMEKIFTADVLVYNFMSCTMCSANDKRRMFVSGQITPETSHELDTSELVELLQKYAVEGLTEFRHLEVQGLSSLGKVMILLAPVTTDFEALYAYKCGEYQRCLQLSTKNVHSLGGLGGMASISTFPEFIQLLDDNIVSLVGLALIVDPLCRDDLKHVKIHQLFLSLYLMAMCQMNLQHSVTTLVQTLDYVKVGFHWDNLYEHIRTLDRLLLKLTKRKIVLYISNVYSVK